MHLLLSPAPTFEYLSQYASTYPTLSAEAERALCIRWRDRFDISAAQRLTASHLYLLFKVARCYDSSGVPTDDLIGEGYLGLMQAVCRFNPDCVARFADYAIWWIHAAIQARVLRDRHVIDLSKADRRDDWSDWDESDTDGSQTAPPPRGTDRRYQRLIAAPPAR